VSSDVSIAGTSGIVRVHTAPKFTQTNVETKSIIAVKKDANNWLSVQKCVTAQDLLDVMIV